MKKECVYVLTLHALVALSIWLVERAIEATARGANPFSIQSYYPCCLLPLG